MNTKTALSNALKKLMDKAVFKNNGERDYRRLRLNRKMFRGCARFARDYLYRRYSWYNHRVAQRQNQARQNVGGETRHGNPQGQPHERRERLNPRAHHNRVIVGGNSFGKFHFLVKRERRRVFAPNLKEARSSAVFAHFSKQRA